MESSLESRPLQDRVIVEDRYWDQPRFEMLTDGQGRFRFEDVEPGFSLVS